MPIMAETRQLSLHPLAIHTFIKAQAGSLGKALSEAVMNSIDAFAQNIEVTLTTHGFTIKDDGQGFKSRDEIKAWFETLGFPHDEGNHRVYGKFGMGRAQMWAYAHTVWSSNEFVMRVDVKNKGLDYQLEMTPSTRAGTQIEGTFYTPVSFPQVEMVATELQNLVRYAPALVIINRQAVTRDPSVEAWDLETEHAWMRFDKSKHSLDVYNGGILVSHFPKYRFGCSGIVVTKPEHTLALNLARNDILEAECTVWPHVRKAFPKEKKVEKTVKAKPAIAALQFAGKSVVEGSLPIDKALKEYPGLIVSVHGRTILFDDLVNYRGLPVMFVPKGDAFGKRLSKLKRAVVLAKESLEFFGLTTPTKLKALVLQHAVATRPLYQSERISKSLWSDDPHTLFADLSEGREVFALSELTAEEQLVRNSWTRCLNTLVQELRPILEGTPLYNQVAGLKTVMLGDCPTRIVWIAHGRELVMRKADVMKAMRQPIPLFSQYVVKMLQALLTGEDDSAEDGTLRLVRVLTETKTLGYLLLYVMSHYIQGCRFKDLPVPTTKLEELERLGVE